jgi:hypothetical protein
MRIDRMHKLFNAVLLCLAVTLLAACGGGSSDAFTAPPDQGGVTTPLATLTLLTSSPQVPSDGALPVTLTAQVQDEDNNFVPDVVVAFSADSGGLAVTQGTTDASGRALATLSTAGDPTNRSITVTATVTEGGVTLSDSVTVSVIGTQLTVTGPSNLVLGDTTTYTVVLADANSTGISGQTVAITSSNGNTLSAASLTTDAAGQAQFSITATAAGDDVVSASALGMTATRVVSVSDDSFAFIAPAPGAEVNLNTNRTLNVRWTQGGAAVVGETISFSTTRGTLSAFSADTNASGEASVTISSANAGAANITASTAGGPSTQISIEFVATVPDTIEVQSSDFNIAPNEQATITAIVRDPNNNLVKNKVVVFELEDVTGGSLSVGSAITDSQGRAQTFYTASSSTSASEGVVIRATVQGTNVTDSTALTVARREVFFAFGTGNTMSEPNDAQYSVPFVLQATDADGNGVAGITVQLSILSVTYLKGVWVADLLNDLWYTQSTTPTPCADEDVNHNGVLDAGEDFNASGQIEAGNIALVAPGSATTDDNGSVTFEVLYPQVYGLWLQVRLEAKTDVQGTEFSEGTTFVLPVIASDVDSLDVSPPGVLAPPDPANGLPTTTLVSPFGYSDSCSDTI